MWNIIPPSNFFWNRIIYKITQNFKFLKTFLSRYGIMALWYYVWKHSQIYYNNVYHIYMLS